MKKRIGVQVEQKRPRFVFLGRVEAVKPALKLGTKPGLFVVKAKLIQPLLTPEGLTVATGQEIVIRMPRSGEVAVGQERVFYTNPWAYGNQLAVLAVKHSEVPENLGAFARRISSTAETEKRKELRSRMNESTVVFWGKVLKTRPDSVVGDKDIGFDNPGWREAIVRIEKIVKGNYREKSIVVHFPRSRDHLWARSHKFRRGETGLWLLRMRRVEDKGSKIFTALSPADFLTLKTATALGVARTQGRDLE